MRPHPRAKGNLYQRRLFVRRVLEQGWSVAEASDAAGWSERTGFKWLRRFREEGEVGLEDRRSGPRRPPPNRTSARRIERILRLRRKRMTSWEIGQRMAMPWSTVSGILRREGVGKLKLLEPKPASRRYERSVAGELVHFDVKPFGRWRKGPGPRATGNRARRDRGAGWEFAHVAVDDASRLAYVEVLPDQKGVTAVEFLERALRFFKRHRLRVKEILSDNGSCYVSRRFRQACKRHGLRHIRTKPYRPQTNGKAERFIQTMLTGWAYKRAYRTSNQRIKALPAWLRYYNEERPHRALGMISPKTKIRRAA
jgi:transposase InsO family protein